MTKLFARTLAISLLHSGPLQETALSSSIRHLSHSEKETLEDEDLFGAISDAEALLACHAYLRRKRRLEWTAAAERHKRREQAIAAADEGPLSGLRPVGFFWEDRSQLPYVGLSDYGSEYKQDTSEQGLEQKAVKNNFITQVGDWALLEKDEDGYDLEESVDTWESLAAPDKMSPFSLPIDEDDEAADVVIDDFSAIDYVPSLSHTRRSLAAMRRWSDPAWKEKWWNSRWGNRKSGFQSKKQKLNSSRQRRTEMRVRKLKPDELLASPEMAELSHDEIAEAIRTYRLSKRKRSRSRRAFLEQRFNEIDRNYSVSFDKDEYVPIPRDYFVQIDESKMREKQRKRSEVAKRIYEKRLENELSFHGTKDIRQDTKYMIAAPDESLPVATTPKEALKKINASLEACRFPSIHDVELVLAPKRLAKRKDTLIRILKDCFGLRGKCIPVDTENSSGEKNLPMRFVTDCSLDVIGEFVLRKLEESQKTT